jgi:flagellar biosynthesis/type III secretory pathway chaperone
MEVPEERPKQTTRDYFSTKSAYNSRKVSENQENVRPTTSGPESRGGSQPSSPQTPHIAFQEKGRDPAPEVLDTMRKRSGTGNKGALTNGSGNDKTRETRENSTRNGNGNSNGNGSKDSEKFKLQEVPKRRKSGSSARNSRSEITSPLDTSITPSQSKSAPASASVNSKDNNTLSSSESTAISRSDSVTASSIVSKESKTTETGSIDSSKPHSSPKSTQNQNFPQRGESLQSPVAKVPTISRKEVPASKYGSDIPASKYGSSPLAIDSAHTPASAVSAVESPGSSANINGGRIISRPIESPISKSSNDFMQPPARAKDRPLMSVNSTGDSFVSPRAPPHPPMEIHHRKNESISTLQSESTRDGEITPSPNLPHYSVGGEFSMTEDMTRILGTEEQDQDQASFLRRVSNSVRHARSYSDRGTRLSREQKWPKSPLLNNGTVAGKFSRDGTPQNSSPENREDLGHFMIELRNLRQSNSEKDQRIAELEKSLEKGASLNQMNTELRKKRSTMVVLDAQKDIVIRELEVMTDKIALTKQSGKAGEPLDLSSLTNSVLVEFGQALQKLKDSFTPQIEELTEQKLSLIEEVSSLKQQKEAILRDIDQTIDKNAQLTDINNQLVQQINSMEGVVQPNRGYLSDGRSAAPQGLGIYTHHGKDKSVVSMDSQTTYTPSTQDTRLGSSINLDHENEPATILSAPQVVNIRKGQPKKFNWKKGGQNVAKGVTKGLKGAFSATAPNNEIGNPKRNESITEGMPYGAMPQDSYPSTTLPPRSTGGDPTRQGFGFFGSSKPKAQAKPAMNGNPGAVVAENASGMFRSHLVGAVTNRRVVLFGSELEQRAEYEHGIPGIIQRCIQEVELRGNLHHTPSIPTITCN